MGLATKNTELTQTKSSLTAQNAPRVNIVAGALFLLPLILGIIPTLIFMNPAGVIAGLILGLLLAQAPKVANMRESSGSQARALRRNSRPGLFGSCR
jgi:hypothetical protein